MAKSCEDSKGIHFEEPDPRHYDTLNIVIPTNYVNVIKYAIIYSQMFGKVA